MARTAHHTPYRHRDPAMRQARSYPRASNKALIAQLARRDEHAARRKAHVELTRAGRAIDASRVDGSDLFEAAEEVDVEPVRHRHNAVWDSW